MTSGRILAVAGVACIVVTACAATTPRGTGPASGKVSQAPGDTAAPSGSIATTGAAAAQPGSEPPPAETPPAPSTTGTKPIGPRLAWVNPARCLSVCTFHPGDALSRVNDQGQADPRGHHRVEAAALASLRELLTAARAAGHALRISSAFRSYEEQARVFRTTKERGRAARPGHSEHQLGTTIDLRLPTSLAITWLAEHAPEYGFALSYPPGKQRTTGYRPEPWHVRFVGRQVAGELHERGGTLEELFRSRPELAESGTCADCPAPASRVACGAVTDQGRCEGSVLSWCYEGTLAMVDCAAFDHTCGRATPTTLPDCLPGPTEPSAPGR